MNLTIRESGVKVRSASGSEVPVYDVDGLPPGERADLLCEKETDVHVERWLFRRISDGIAGDWEGPYFWAPEALDVLAAQIDAERVSRIGRVVGLAVRTQYTGDLKVNVLEFAVPRECLTSDSALVQIFKAIKFKVDHTAAPPWIDGAAITWVPEAFRLLMDQNPAGPKEG